MFLPIDDVVSIFSSFLDICTHYSTQLFMIKTIIIKFKYESTWTVHLGEFVLLIRCHNKSKNTALSLTDIQWL